MTTSTTTFDRARAVARSAAARLRRWFDPPLDADARPLEIRNAIIEQIEQFAEPAAAGRRVLPRNRIVVSLLANDSARERLEVSLGDLDAAVRTRLSELRCPLPHGFSIDLTFVEEPLSGWTDGQRVSVELLNATGGRVTSTSPQAPETSPPSAPAAGPVPRLRIVTRRGATTEPEYLLSEARVLIGRTAAPVDRAGRPRYNHVVFLDEGDEHNATVGRAHASIQFEPVRRQFRLFDEGSHNGTRIVRQGETIDVTPRNPVGVALLSGDEIQFGTAAVVVTIE
jgi:hypothetical protein